VQRPRNPNQRAADADVRPTVKRQAMIADAGADEGVAARRRLALVAVAALPSAP
jgi:hypothetical protein